ncbi:alpha-(1,3)-fucosyltransferase 11-like [Sycon ciliatum]|uniref:alpha-(1,3)-fucosyltransferase 11-like n=1 Tax=Sycon ciliatum TaxID=27933 RepID=UPI0031F63AB4
MMNTWTVLVISGAVLAAAMLFMCTRDDGINNTDSGYTVESVGWDAESRAQDADSTSTGDAEPAESQVPEERMNKLPWLVWHGMSPTDPSKGHEISCLRGSCIVKSQHAQHAPMYLNDNTRALLMYGSGSKPEAAPLPRLKHHMWALLHEESPKNNAMYSHDAGISLFNITSTFRQASDLPLTLQYLPNLDYLLSAAPVPVEQKNIYRNDERHKLAAVAYIQSTCINPSYRDTYVKKLMEHIPVDALGECLNNRKLPEEYQTPHAMFQQGFYDVLRKYKFIIAFENGICDDYITEKLWRPLHLGTVPIYRGAPNVNEWLPTHRSALVYDEFENPAALADYIKYLDSNDTAYREYLEYKKGPEYITNEKLKSSLEDRPYSAANFEENASLFDELSSKPNFIVAFECKVCDRVIERQQLERKHSEEGLPAPSPWIADSSHYGCPPPEEWRDEFALGNGDVLDWRVDYDRGKRHADALTRLILANATHASQSHASSWLS